MADTLSLSQLLLAPLDSIFKAQVHAARSFLSFVLQMGYPHLVLDENGVPNPDPNVNPPENFKPYELGFHFQQVQDGQAKTYEVKIPALAMLPLNSLSVESAEFSVALRVTDVREHSQMQKSEESKLKQEGGKSKNYRPWYLVDDPRSLRGEIATSPSQLDGESRVKNEQSSLIDIKVKVSRTPVPAALDKLLTSLTQAIQTQEKK